MLDTHTALHSSRLATVLKAFGKYYLAFTFGLICYLVLSAGWRSGLGIRVCFSKFNISHVNTSIINHAVRHWRVQNV